MIFLRILVFVGGVLIGVLILKYSGKIVENVGHSDLADKYLGFGTGGGTYTMWKIIGILIIIAGVVFAVRGW